MENFSIPVEFLPIIGLIVFQILLQFFKKKNKQEELKNHNPKNKTLISETPKETPNNLIGDIIYQFLGKEGQENKYKKIHEKIQESDKFDGESEFDQDDYLNEFEQAEIKNDINYESNNKSSDSNVLNEKSNIISYNTKTAQLKSSLYQNGIKKFLKNEKNFKNVIVISELINKPKGL